jgi:hypothetical protein
MGFTEIVLLGCDFNSFASRQENHFYDIKKNINREASLWRDLLGHAIVCFQHEYLRNYASERNINILNSTDNSLLDIYIRRPF